ncbi:MAG: sugar phosphate isomerase/epimerase family protein [Christensenellales bacterium]|jgi:L-ribulose-5-phosphate 3-epimerase
MSKFLVSAFADEIGAPLDLQMEVLSRYGIRYIEFRAADGKPVADYTVSEARAALARMKDRGFAVSAVGSPIGKIDIRSDFEPHMEKFLHVLELAHALETSYIRMFSFFIPEGEAPATYRGKVMDQLGRLADAARGSGVMLLHENEKAIYGDIPERCRDILDTMDPTVMRGIYDFSNFVQCGVQNYPFAWNLLRDSIVYFHMKDSVYSDRKAERDMGRQITGNVHRPCGQGDGECLRILSEAAAAGFEGFVSIEPHLGEEYGPTGAERFDAAARAVLSLVESLQ